MAPFSNMYRIGCLAIIVALLQFVSSDEIVPDSAHQWTEVDFQRVGQVSELIRNIRELEEGSEDVEMLHRHSSSWKPQPGYEAYNKLIKDNTGKDNQYPQLDVDLSDVIRDLFRYESDDQSYIGYDPQVAEAITYFGVTFEDVVSGGDHGLTLHIINLAGSEWMTDSFDFIDQKMKQEGKSPALESFLSFMFYLSNDEKESFDSLYNNYFKKLFRFLYCVSNNQRLDDISADAQDHLAKLVYRFITADQDLVPDVIDDCHARLAIIIINKCGIDWLKAYSNGIHIKTVGITPDKEYRMWAFYDNQYQESMPQPSVFSPHDQDLQQLYTFLHEKLVHVSFPHGTRKALDEIERHSAVLASIPEEDRLQSLRSSSIVNALDFLDFF